MKELLKKVTLYRDFSYATGFAILIVSVLVLTESIIANKYTLYISLIINYIILMRIGNNYSGKVKLFKEGIELMDKFDKEQKIEVVNDEKEVEIINKDEAGK